MSGKVHRVGYPKVTELLESVTINARRYEFALVKPKVFRRR